MKVIKTETVDKKAIEQAKQQLDSNRKYCQKLVDMFSNINVPIKIEDLQSLSAWANNGGGQYFDELIRLRALDMPENKALAGKPMSVINKTLKVPDYSSVVNWLRKNPYEGNLNVAIDVTHLEIRKNDVIVSDSAFAKIKEQNTKTSIVPDYDAINNVLIK